MAFDASECSKLNVSTALMHYQMVVVTRTQKQLEKTPLLTMAELITETKQKDPVIRFFDTIVHQFGQSCLPRIVVLDYVPSTIESLIGKFNSGVLCLSDKAAFERYKALMESDLDDPQSELKGLTIVISCKKHVQSNITNKCNYGFKCSTADQAFLFIILKVLMHEEDYKTSMDLWGNAKSLFCTKDAKVATQTYRHFINLYNPLVKYGGDEPDRITFSEIVNNDEKSRENRFCRADMKKYFDKLFDRRYLFGGLTRHYVRAIFGGSNSDLIDTTAHVESKFGDMKTNLAMDKLSVVEYVLKALELWDRDLLQYHDILRQSAVKGGHVQSVSTIIGANKSAIDALTPLFTAERKEKDGEKWNKGKNKSAQSKSIAAHLRTDLIKKDAPIGSEVVVTATTGKQHKAAKEKTKQKRGSILGSGKISKPTQQMINTMELIQRGDAFCDKTFLVRI